MTKIRVEDLYFAYNSEEKVLRGISLSFDTAATAIIGQNGAGKTTFVKLLKGLLKPDSGTVAINGLDTRRATAAELSKQIGLVFQNPNDQIFKNTVIDEVMFGPLNIGQPPGPAKDNSLRALDMVGLAGCVEAHPYDLSLAERKLVSIASILAMQTEILIFDEPTIAQDFSGRERIKKIINDLREQGKLILTITHDMDFVAETFERVIVFQNGKVLLDGDTRRVFAAGNVLSEAYLEPPHITQLGRKLGCRDTFLTPGELIGYLKEEP